MHPATDHLRAALIALHVFAITALALPSAGSGLNRKAWNNPTVQEEFAQWSERLGTLGIALPPDELQDVAYAFASSWNTVQSTAVAPFKPYYRHFGTYQSWRMFVAPHRYPARLHVDIDRGEGWEPLYVARSEVHTWRRRQLDQDRLRSAIFRYGWRKNAAYTAFGRWLAARAAEDFPDARRMRTRFFVYKTLPPEQVRAGVEPEGTWKGNRGFRLEEFR